MENRVILLKQNVTGHLVPKIIHQFWTGPEMPSAVRDAVASWTRVRTHNQNMTVAAIQMAERKSSPHLS
jgi:mannosyltransferase OCH1-like enzyme